MIVGLDLDDTLYRELDYVESGFRAVAEHVGHRYGTDTDDAFDFLLRSLERSGRGALFDELLLDLGAHTVTRRNELVQVYRQHQPTLSLPAESRQVLDELRAEGHRLFLVTDGNHRVQGRKVTALGLWDDFEHCYLTYRYGRAASKPSTKVFELMLRRTRAQPSDLVYIGDNPHKDFVGIRRLGAHSVRIHTGGFADDKVDVDHDGDHHIDHIGQLPAVVSALSAGR